MKTVVFILGLVCLYAAITCPAMFFSTSEYDCIILNATQDKVFEIYQRSGPEAKVWVNLATPLEGSMWHLSLEARSTGGENDIDSLLSGLKLNYYRLDD